MQVWLDVFGVRGVHRVSAIGFMATHRRPLRRIPGVSFAKLMGTGSGDSFTLADADLGHWAILTVVESDAVRARVMNSSMLRRWSRICTEHASIQMRTLHSHGHWSGQDPFPATPLRLAPDQPVASITRARLRPRMLRTFWRSVPPVVDDLRHEPAILFSLGIGEAPLGLQGTFSIWKSGKAMSDFAYRRPAHQRAIEQTHQLDWYAEELFARFAVDSVTGTYRGRPMC